MLAIIAEPVFENYFNCAKSIMSQNIISNIIIHDAEISTNTTSESTNRVSAGLITIDSRVSAEISTTSGSVDSRVSAGLITTSGSDLGTSNGDDSASDIHGVELDNQQFELTTNNSVELSVPNVHGAELSNNITSVSESVDNINSVEPSTTEPPNYTSCATLSTNDNYKPCRGGEIHLYQPDSPGAGWTRKRVFQTCIHRGKYCWTKQIELQVDSYKPCGSYLHISIKACKSQPDNRVGWSKKQIMKGCIHRGQTCWEISRS
jgi:hypothetical protein